MRKSIRKFASLCLAMAMILSVLAMPAFAEQRAVHIHNYNIVLSTHTEYNDINAQTHRQDVTTHLACTCGETTVDFASYIQLHVPDGPAFEISGETPFDGPYLYFTCKYCGHTYPVES